jgi:glycosyltransferase involved in cell wall biosynthesis
MSERQRTRLKVLFVCAADISASKLLSAQIRALNEAGFDVHVACSDGPYARAMIRDGYNVQIVPILNRPSLRANLKTIAQLYRLIRRERYHVVHVHMISAAFLGRIAAWLARTPLILYTFRGFAFYPGGPAALKAFNLTIERLCGKMTDFFFVQAEGNRARAVEAGVIPADRSVTIGNGIRIPDFLCDSDDRQDISGIREELGVPKGALVVGYVGRLVREKGVQELVMAVAGVLRRHPEAVLLIVGEALSSDLDAKQELDEQIRREGIESKVVFAGFREDMPRMYRAMDIFVLPSYREGAPRSIMEAMASGKPVVATDIAGCRDQVIQGVTGILVPPRDAVSLESALLHLLDDLELRRKFGEAGRARAREHFDEREVCRRVVRCYQQLVGMSEQGQDATDHPIIPCRGSPCGVIRSDSGES